MATTEHIRITGDASGFKKATSQAESRFEAFGKRVEGISSSVGKLSAIVTGFGLIGVFSQLKGMAEGIAEGLAKSRREAMAFKRLQETGGGGTARIRIPGELPRSAAALRRQAEEMRAGVRVLPALRDVPVESGGARLAAGQTRAEARELFGDEAIQRMDRIISELSKLEAADQIERLAESVERMEARAKQTELPGIEQRIRTELPTAMQKQVLEAASKQEGVLAQLKVLTRGFDQMLEQLRLAAEKVKEKEFTGTVFE